MFRDNLSIVIVTYNRSALLRRAIESVVGQSSTHTQIIVVDNASTDNTAAMVQCEFPSITYVRNEANSGPSIARNLGLRHAARDFVLFLDDDDTLDPRALEIVEIRLSKMGEEFLASYPVFQFACSNGHLCLAFKKVILDDYLTGCIRGDFTPIINRGLFSQFGLAYPSMQVGAEHLLWWEVAGKFGIPTWADCITRLHDDAPIRLTSYKERIRRAQDHAMAGEVTLQKFGAAMKEGNYALYVRKIFGVTTYSLLAGDRRRARKYLQELKETNLSERVIKCGLWIATYMPETIVRFLFARYNGR